MNKIEDLRPGSDPTPEAMRLDKLSPREREVLRLIGQGLITDEIATQLDRSSHTVRSHVKNAMRKLDATTRSHAAVMVALNEVHR